jgi:uncharacterized protein (DUF362 family)
MKSTFWDETVAIVGTKTKAYSTVPPFNPDKKYPEFTGESTDSSNKVYGHVRSVFKELGLDAKNYGKKSWNPLNSIVTPGDTVCLKPNFVMHYNWSGDTVFAVITHASIIRAMADYVLIALKGKGRLIIGDAPQADANFQKLTEVTGMDAIIADLKCRAKGVEIEYIDFRKKLDVIHEGVCIREDIVNGDPRGYARANLGAESLLAEKNHLLLYGSDYDREKTICHHKANRHEYVVSKSVLASNVIISLPKLKTHKKAGVTLNLKNMIGINGDKNFIPHYCVGDKRSGGDEFPVTGNKWDQRKYKFTRKMLDLLLGKWGKYLALPISYGVKAYKVVKTGSTKVKSRHGGFSVAELFWRSFLKKPYRAGNWHGNDTVWRCTLDLNKVLIYGNKEGVLQKTQQRKFFSLIDGIVAGEKEGPLEASAKPCGVLIGGFNPVVVDTVAAQYMGFDTDRIPTLVEGHNLQEHPLCKARYVPLKKNKSVKYATSSKAVLNLTPSAGWKVIKK